jgi:O-antigen/teichoic acid export membrane protein
VIFLVLVAKLSVPHLRFSLRQIDRVLVKSLLRFTSQFSLTSMAGMLLPVFEKFVLASFVGVAATGYYEIAWRIVEWLRRVPQLFLVPAIPIAANRRMDEPAALHALYAKLLDFTVLMSAPLFLVAMALARPLIQVWTGPGTEAAAFALCILAATHFCNTLTGPAAGVLAGTDRMKPLLIATGLTMLLCIVLEPILAGQAGFCGLLVGSLIGFGIVGSIGFVVYLHFYYPALAIDKLTFTVILWAVSAAILPSVMVRFGYSQGWVSVSAASLVLAGIVSLIMYGMGVSVYRPNRLLLERSFIELEMLVIRWRATGASRLLGQRFSES